VRKRSQPAKRLEDFFPNAAGSAKVVERYEFPNVDDVSRRSGMKFETLPRAHLLRGFLQ